VWLVAAWRRRGRDQGWGRRRSWVDIDCAGRVEMAEAVRRRGYM
jgi:hypothetical protein